MSKPEHDHHGHRDHQHNHPPSARWRPHHDWRFWVAVVLMLAAMVAYVASMDESIWPGGKRQMQPAVPVDAGGPAK
jgi:hypothetical protein